MTEFLPGKFFDVEPTTVDTLREKLRVHMEFLKSMNVREHTLYKKYIEVQDYRKMANRSSVTKANIWTPTDITDKERTIKELGALEPKIMYVSPDDKQLTLDWQMLRVFCHTMNFDQNPGRFYRFIVYDEPTGKWLGAASIGSDVISIRVRDAWIGWEREWRQSSGRLNNSTIATCIMACQPFGYNFLGGKLVAALMTDRPVADAWEAQSGDKLVGLTTTSLYGASSMYNGIPYWKTLGETEGKIYLKPDDSVYKEWHDWLKKNKYDEYIAKTVKDGIVGPVTGIKQKILDMAFKYASIKPSRYTHGFKRGVYYALLYENTKEYLRGEIELDALIEHPRLTGDRTQRIVEWWRKKAIKRYTKLLDNDGIKPELLYYNDIIGSTWNEAKELYLGEVGR